MDWGSIIDSKILALVIFFIILVIVIGRSAKKRVKIMELFFNKAWLIGFITIICFSVWTIYSTKPGEDGKITKENESKREALKKAIVAFIIALFSEINMSIAPFWLVFALAYYLDDWV